MTRDLTPPPGEELPGADELAAWRALGVKLPDLPTPRCEWEGHNAALDEAGWCPVCDEGNLDPEWAERNGVDTSLDGAES